ncbi:3'(2'),5'-bisphosphate nucleotidase CysQ [Mangrovicella endophytica]|uniref:3'(2'),5'-bisphosphate nucleotidase CysQ n=1 Tax=Mangrovicella endophytica TaxID=2066697 RepID=UPI000C9E180D|nr:3'(2'),5'-bisphosphate nucleotidase CysQ [Mangrovicella endophytica]
MDAVAVNLAAVESLAIAAGQAILAVRDGGISICLKADASPVTEADQQAEALILEGLAALAPTVPVVAEEATAAGDVPTEIDGQFFLVDPLDGTREFVEGRADFTVNIALIEEGVPVLGVVYAPARGVLYSGSAGEAFLATIGPDGAVADRRAITVRARPSQIAAVASRSHRTPETDTYLARYEVADCVSVGSSLKFCVVAAGEADLYPRLGRTMEWDTAAGDAVLRAAGGSTTTLDGRPLVYGKRHQAGDCDFANPHFVAFGGAPA